VDSVETPADSPPEGSLLSVAPGTAAAQSGPDREVLPFVKAYFMHTWVEALYSFPGNNNPNPNWQSPLIDPVGNRVWCTDCHVSGQVNFENIPKRRDPMVDELEEDLEFMADLMRKWVSRLNSDEYGARRKLTGPVTCLTCHETDPAPR
jgi:hypothetical protein